MRRTVIFLSLLVCAAPLVAAEGSWIHVEVRNTERRGSTVRVHLPMTALLRALPLIPQPSDARCRFVVGDARITPEDLRRLWQQIEASPEGTVARHANRDVAIDAARSGGVVRFRVQDRFDREPASVTMHEPVVRALASARSGDGLAVALRALAEEGGGEILMIGADDSRVRVWIDAGPGPREE